MRLLVYKNSLSWPRRSGHDVHTFEIMRKWIAAGSTVHLVTANRLHERALEGIKLQSISDLSKYSQPEDHNFRLGKWLANRYARYWGIPDSHIAAVGRLADKFKVDAVVVSGLDALPLLLAVNGTIRIWYAADEWFFHHISLVRLCDRSTWGELKVALVKGLYERSYQRFVDRIWVVSEVDRRAMRIVSGVKNVDIISNGVDLEYFTPCKQEQEIPKSVVFWGRLDFDPNIQALEWFCKKVWPLLLERHPDAKFTIIGAQPCQRVRDLSSRAGIKILADVDDIRSPAAAHEVVILPFVSGGGVKNKLLEAAALGKAIVSSPVGIGGLRGRAPLCVAATNSEWLVAIERLWKQPSYRRELGTAARNWVCKEHTWHSSAKTALDTIISSRQHK